MVLALLMALLSPSSALADAKIQCAPTGWSCSMDPCCSILDYCKFGTCTPNNQVYHLSSLSKATKNPLQSSTKVSKLESAKSSR